MKVFIKAKAFLLAISLIWLWLIITVLPLQVLITFLPIFSNRASLKKWRLNFWLAQDQYINAIFFGNCDVTISSRVGWLAANGSKTAQLVELVIDWLFFIATKQVGHCRASIEQNETHHKVKL